MKTKFFAKRILASSIAAAAALFWPAAAHAEDVDIFTPNTTTARANVLIILDNSSNWSSTLGTNDCKGVAPFPANTSDNTKFSAEVCALYNVIGALGPDIRVGLMLFAESGENGGYVRHGMRSMTDANKTVFKNLLASFIANGSNSDTSGSNQPYGRVMYEAYKYFGGWTTVAKALANDNTVGGALGRTQFGFEAYAGGGSTNSTGAKRLDAANNNTPANRAAKVYGATDPFAMLDKNDNSYNPASALTDDCSKNFIIFISNGNPSTGGDSGGVATAEQLLANVYPGSTPPVIRSGGVERHASKMDEFAKFLWETDVSSRPGQQRVMTFTFAVYQPQASGLPSNTDQQMINLMESAAANGGGASFSVTSAKQLQDELLKVLNDVQAVNSAFVSSSLPVSVNTQGTFLNQVYMGLFRPDGSASPRWLGNLKQYKFIQNAGGELFLGDSLSLRAVNDANGFIKPSAVSFWTSPSTFWVNNQMGTPPSASDSPDGDLVEKGGTAEQQRIDYAVSRDTRKMLTCTGTCSGAPLEFNTTTITGSTMETAFGAASAAELSALVNWVRGEDNTRAIPCSGSPATCPAWTSGERGPGWPTTVRASIHGDVLHSRPVVLNYAGRGPYVFYGANDGLLRAVKGGQAGSDGHEVWSFVAPEFYSRFKRLRDASPELRTPNTPASLVASTLPKDYFFDGPIGSYESGTTKWIFVGARRGGRVIYAIDVSDPENPQLLWKNTEAQLPRLGQTWSVPWAFRKTGVTNPYLMFGAGYDTGEDAVTPVDNGLGRGIYVLDARTGAMLRFIDSGSDTVRSPISSDMALVSTKLVIDNEKPESGVYRAYVGDLGGNVWRLDIPDGDVANWKLFKLAALGSDRKIFYAPDVVHAGDKDVVLVGSGDREKPLMTTSQDSFYALFDTTTDIGVAASITTIVPGDLTLLTSLTTPVTSTKGWYRNMALGEKVINSPLTVAGVTYFATNKPTPPAPGVCNANLGEARAYAVTFNAGLPPATDSGPGTTLSTKIQGGGLPPSAIGGVVDLGNGKTVAFVIGAGDKPPEPKRVTLTIPKTRKKVYWSTKSDM